MFKKYGQRQNIAKVSSLSEQSEKACSFAAKHVGQALKLMEIIYFFFFLDKYVLPG